jgi:ribose-phosphate pyrophosphokinase
VHVSDKLRMFSGNAHRELAEAVCEYLDFPMGYAEVGRFKDGEIFVRIKENIRGADVFVFQPTFPPADNLTELLIMLDAVRRASASRVVAVVPYFGYARQDRKDQPRVAISAKLVANLIATAGATRVVTMDLHSAQIQGFFDIPFDHLYAAPIIIDYFQNKQIPNLVVLAPDVGSVKMARAYAKRMDAGLAITDKRRPKPDVAEAVNVIGDVSGKNVVIIDDMISTGTSMLMAARAARERGAQDVYAACTHPVFCGDVVKSLTEAEFKEVIVTDTIPIDPSRLIPSVKILTVAPLLGEAVRRIHEERSLSSLFV